MSTMGKPCSQPGIFTGGTEHRKATARTANSEYHECPRLGLLLGASA